MARKVELLTADAQQEVLYPRSTSDMIIHGNSTVDVELGKKLNASDLPIEVGIFTPTVLADTTPLNTVSNNTFGRYYRLGNVCYVSGRVSFNNPQNLTGHLKIGGFPVAPRKDYESVNLGLYHGLNFPTNAKEIKAHLNSTFPGINIYYTTHNGGDNAWLAYGANNLSQSGGSISFSGFYSCVDY